MEMIYDLIILGAGPAGLAAGLYGGRYRLNTLLIERGQDGGQIAITSEIENYPGQMVDQEESGATIARAELSGPVKRLTDTRGNVYEGKTVILATGAHPRPIGCKNEREFLGKGISFCATCDANFYEGMEVFVVGGGDSAVEEAMYLTKFARKVTVIHRRDQLRAAVSIQEKAFRNEKLHFMWDSVVDEVSGDGILDRMVVRNVKTGELTEVLADPEDGMFGLFGFIGYLPNTELFADAGLEMENGYIRTDEDMQTNLPGVYAAGDLRVKSLRQVVTAAADGAIAASRAERYVSELE